MGLEVLKLYPPPSKPVPLFGLYLSHRLHTLGTDRTPFVYANFLSSLDGRIALYDPVRNENYLPKNLTSANDFRLFLELHAQADCLITHGGYLRSLAEGKLGNILQVGVSPGAADLLEWRKSQGITNQPTLIIASASLDFPLPETIQQHEQKCYIATGEMAKASAVKQWEQKGYPVFRAGRGKYVEGKLLVKKLRELGCKCIYLIAGPRMLETMINDGQLNRLYHTTLHRMLGGKTFHTIIRGERLGEPGMLRLRSLYYDQGCPDNSGQWFAQFDLGQ